MTFSIKRVVTSIFMTVVSSIVLYLANLFVSGLLEMINASAGSLMGGSSSRRKTFNGYETQIAQNIVQPGDISERLDNIGGLAVIKDAIRTQVLMPLKHAKIFFGTVKALHPPRGILLHGPPGTGKTMLARAIAAEAGCPFLSLTLSNLENKFFGESSKLLSATFTLARKMQPCVIFFDEIDGMIRTRSDHDQSCVYGFKTEFLTHMDGISTKKSDAVIVIGCTNCAEKLDPAVKRRLPQQYKVDLPSEDEMADIFALNLKDSLISRSQLEQIAKRVAPGVSGSDIHDVVQTAWSIHLSSAFKTPGFSARLEDENTTAEDIQRVIGTLSESHILSALEKTGRLKTVDDEGGDGSDDDEGPPPSET